MNQASIKHYLFLHIPKAGGSTLRTILQRQFRHQEIYLIGDDINGDIQRFRELDKSEAAQYALLMGHMRFGLHSQFDGEYSYLSMLRDPVSRVISEYRFLKSNPYHSLHGLVSEMNFDQYLTSAVSDQISNGQVRLLCGTENVSGQGVPQVRDMTEADLEQALQNVNKHFKQIGFIERYDESLIIWQKLFGWRWPLYIQSNVGSPDRGDIEVISRTQRAKIEALNVLDIKLYNRLLADFDRRLRQDGIGFRVRLYLFRKLNKLYTYYRHLRAK